MKMKVKVNVFIGGSDESNDKVKSITSNIRNNS